MSVSEQNSVLNRVRTLDQRHATVIDLLALFTIPTVILSGIFFLWPASERVLEYKARNPTLVGTLGSDFAHRGIAHLGTNLVGLWLLGGFGYFFARYTGRRNLYRVSFFSYLTILPFLASPFIRWMLADTPETLAKLESVGFSQTGGALAAFLAIAIGLYYHQITGESLGSALLSVGLFFGGLGVLFLNFGEALDVTVLTIGIGVLTLIYLGTKAVRSFRSLHLWTTFAAIVVFYLAIGGLFGPGAGGGIYGHLAGYWWGFVLSGFYLLLAKMYRQLPDHINTRIPSLTL